MENALVLGAGGITGIAEIEALRQGSTVALVAPDEATLTALGPNVFDAGRWEAAIEAGIAQGEGVAPEVAAVWKG